MSNIEKIKDIVENNNFSFNSDNNEKIYKTNELISIINTKYETEKINQGSYVGNKLRNISVTNLLQCPRLVTYNRLGYKPNIDKLKMYPYAYLMNEVGSFIHEKLSILLGFNEITKKFFKHRKYPILGKVDGILYNVLIEFKTVSDEEFLTLKQPREKDIIQTRILYDICKYNNDYNNINLIKILYISRNLKDVSEFNIHVDDIKNKNIVDKYYDSGCSIYKCLEENKLEERYSLNDCCFCAYSQYCKYYNSNKYTKTNIFDDKIENNNIKINNLDNKETDNIKIDSSENKENGSIKLNSILEENKEKNNNEIVWWL